MTPLEKVQASVEAVRAFPLPSPALFPHALVPLHIFEPRYRAMLRHALDSDKVLALARVAAGPVDDRGEPPLDPICCLGLVVWHEGLPDGRSNIVVQGVVRARILGEVRAPEGRPALPYRRLRVDLLPDPAFHGREEEDLRNAVFQLSSRVPQEFGEKVLQLATQLDGGALADVMSAALVTDGGRRQKLLSELDPQRRLQGVLGEVGDLMARIGPERVAGFPN